MQSVPAKVDRKEAHRIVSLLARGLDPDHPDQVPEENVLHRAHVIRALFLAAETLRSEKSTGNVNDGRVGKPWSTEEDDELKDEIARQEELPSIALHHQRSSGAIVARVVHLRIFESRDAAREHFRR